jgi:magnesium transporter
MAQSQTIDRGDKLHVDDMRHAWLVLSGPERREGFSLLDHTEAEELFLSLATPEQADLLVSLLPHERRLWLRLLPPDDVADVIQACPGELRDGMLGLLDDQARRDVVALLAYKEDVAGGLMSTRFARLRPEMIVDEAIQYLRRQAREKVETLYYAYVLDHAQHLLGVVSFRDLFAARPGAAVKEVMITDVVVVPEAMDQEAVARLIVDNDLIAVPVVDDERRMKGIITVDDIVDVMREEATEDIQKVGGQEALSGPYLGVRMREMIKKRAGWLTVLFIGEMFTATAMGYFEDEIEKAVVLAMFVPLIISAGGNSGSQASTLIIRALALGEVTLRDWPRVLWREMRSGLALGLVLGTIGFVRVIAWSLLFHMYGEHFVLVALTVGMSVVGCVTWGAISGAMLPFILRRVGFDPASASAPFVATLIDVTGLIIYFTVASVIFLRALT